MKFVMFLCIFAVFVATVKLMEIDSGDKTGEQTFEAWNEKFQFFLQPAAGEIEEETRSCRPDFSTCGTIFCKEHGFCHGGVCQCD